ncbi:lipid kinase, YegS/Rv2252/BmrU family [Virgibacillus subterraneus]|uniref:Lipid kinase, YegS/Rv2252/BmrU family n=1 Tax=Virgibacillus subterraneus TaxID=621109 RepID=A0A1H9IS27_9BACI|nr:YegS/Rv2252/BmrU family lipid kinase [Virgibacillus subterraneus]SEQ77338.1 lipid kinase, YegS/Rv2252/BmrU family [Virgibacillus subterraneus]
MGYERGLFLYNGNAGSDNMEQKLSQTLPVISKAIKKLTVIQTESIEEAKDSCKDFADQVDIIIILGGDGTLYECINSLAPLKRRPIIAVLPGGTCNDFSRILSIPQNLYQAAEAIISGEAVKIDIGKTSDKYFLNFWGVGLVSETSLNIDEEQKKNFGVLSYFMSTLKTVNQAEPFTYKIVADDKVYEGESVMILVLNGKFIGTREFPIPTININDGKFDVLVIKNSTLATLRELLSMNRPTTNTEELTELTYFQASTLAISTNQQKAVDMDGEIDGVTPANIEILPRHIQMIGKL